MIEDVPIVESTPPYLLGTGKILEEIRDQAKAQDYSHQDANAIEYLTWTIRKSCGILVTHEGKQYLFPALYEEGLETPTFPILKITDPLKFIEKISLLNKRLLRRDKHWLVDKLHPSIWINASAGDFEDPLTYIDSVLYCVDHPLAIPSEFEFILKRKAYFSDSAGEFVGVFNKEAETAMESPYEIQIAFFPARQYVTTLPSDYLPAVRYQLTNPKTARICALQLPRLDPDAQKREIKERHKHLGKLQAILNRNQKGGQLPIALISLTMALSIMRTKGIEFVEFPLNVPGRTHENYSEVDERITDSWQRTLTAATQTLGGFELNDDNSPVLKFRFNGKLSSNVLLLSEMI